MTGTVRQLVVEADGGSRGNPGPSGFGALVREAGGGLLAEAGERWVEVDVDGDAELVARFSDYVPVVLVDGVQQAFWRVDERRLRAALA